MLRDEALDAVVVAVPIRLHEQVAMAVIDAGKALLVEKPLAPSLDEGRRIADAASKRGVVLTSGHIERFNPAVQELTRRLRQGEAGRVLQVTARRLGPFATRTRDVSVIHDLALHDIDIMLHMLGRDVETRLRADAARRPYRFGRHACRRPALPRRARSALLEVNWLTPRKVRELSVLGERGLFVLDYLAQTLEFYESEPSGGSHGGPGWQTLTTLRGDRRRRHAHTDRAARAPRARAERLRRGAARRHAAAGDRRRRAGGAGGGRRADRVGEDGPSGRPPGPVDVKVAVVGLGKIGLPLAALFAEKGADVIGCDVSQAVVDVDQRRRVARRGRAGSGREGQRPRTTPGA